MSALAIIIIFVVIILVIVWAVNTYYNMQDLKYYEEKRDQAQQRVDELERQGYGPSNFILPYAYGQGLTYEQEQAEQLRLLNEELSSCAATDYLANQTNFKVIEITEGIGPVSGSILKNEHCGNRINEYLENGYTIKGALQDKGGLESSYIIIEKIQ
jgi:hypothetical protein